MDGVEFASRDRFAALLRSQRVLLVAFVATWNAKCVGFVPSFLTFARHRCPSLSLAFVDVDENAALTADYDVFSVPTIMLFENGRETFRESDGNLDLLAGGLVVRGLID